MFRTYTFITGAVLLITLLYPAVPPYPFPSGSIVTVEEGVGLSALAEKLKTDGIIRSPLWFRITAIFLGGERQMKAGQYYMVQPQNTFVIAWRVFHGDYDIETVKLTIPEGFTASKIAALFGDKFRFFDHESFLAFAPEGYLFPDTYFVPVTATASTTIELLHDNFTAKITPVLPDIVQSGKTLGEVLTTASIIESEAKSQEDREIISDIIWKRLKLGMPLQVDAAFVYVNGKTSSELTMDDLEIDSPFNTYLYKGLPPTPISNPGIESIEAALHPTTTPYMYFLTSDDGTMHYSRTFDEHVAKKRKFINQR